MAIALWTARLERPLTERETAALLACLPAERRARVLAMKTAEKRREPLCAYALLLLALGRRAGLREFPEMARSAAGKPYFPEHPALHFNLSHTEGAVLVGLGKRPLGVDIERIRPVSPALMRRMADAGTEEAFFRCWVRREARSKRTGAGVSTMLRREPPLQPEERYDEVETFPGYAAGVAAERSEPLEKLYAVSLEEMLSRTVPR